MLFSKVTDYISLATSSCLMSPIRPLHLLQQIGVGECNRWQLVITVGLTPTGVQRHETKSQTRLISRPDRGRQPTDVGGPLSRCAYTKRWRGAGGTDDEVRCDLFPSPTSPSHRSLRRSGGGNPPYHFGSPALTGSGVVRPPRANAPRIYFHFTDKNLYAGSNDVEFIEQALW
jgi:hypothetical protein